MSNNKALLLKCIKRWRAQKSEMLVLPLQSVAAVCGIAALYCLIGLVLL